MRPMLVNTTTAIKRGLETAETRMEADGLFSGGRRSMEVDLVASRVSRQVPDEAQTRAVWIEWCERHDLSVGDPRRKSVYQAIRNEVESVPVGDVVVDSGAGEATIHAMFPHSHYISVDFIEAAATSDFDFENLDIVGNSNALPLEKNCAALALSVNTLEHLFTPSQTLKELHRVLRPGGRALVYVPFIVHLHMQPFDYLWYTCHGIEELLSDAGFIDVVTYADCTVGYALAYLAEWAFAQLAVTSSDPAAQLSLTATRKTLGDLRGLAAAQDPGLAVKTDSGQGSFALGYIATATKSGGPLTPMDASDLRKVDVMRRLVRCPDCLSRQLIWNETSPMCEDCGTHYPVDGHRIDVLSQRK